MLAGFTSFLDLPLAEIRDGTTHPENGCRNKLLWDGIAPFLPADRLAAAELLQVRLVPPAFGPLFVTVYEPVGRFPQDWELGLQFYRPIDSAGKSHRGCEVPLAHRKAKHLCPAAGPPSAKGITYSPRSALARTLRRPG